MRILFTKLLLILCLSGTAQSEYLGYSDFHIHPTYKHYYRFPNGNVMAKIIKAVKLECDTLYIDPVIRKEFEMDNWTSYNVRENKKGIKDLRKGTISHLKNYDQASYSELIYAPGSILCASFYPFEKQFTKGFIKRLGNSLLVTRMTLRRLNYCSNNEYLPMHDFLAEYYYSQMQKEKQYAVPLFPEKLYSDGRTPAVYNDTKGYYNQFRMVKDNAELRKVLEHNDAFWNNPAANDSFIFITPMLLTIEGAQVLYGPVSGNKKNILHPLLDNGREHLRDTITKELLQSVCLLKNLPHRLFFITLGHFAQNNVVGFAKTLDRDPENIQHRLPALLSKSARIRNNLIRKNYDGFNIVEYQQAENGPYLADSVGYTIVRAFLDTSNTRFRKPTYIDMKHMDIKARIQYYYLRRQLEKELDIKIPIIASHFAVSGESQAMAAATGLWPNYDRYPETEDSKKYYRNYILDADWPATMQAAGYQYHDPLDSFERQMYKPLSFIKPEPYEPAGFNPFVDYDLSKDKNVGWFYPWSINLFDEEIIEIDKSDGIIGLLLDPRQLGGYMPNYRNNQQAIKDAYQQAVVELSDTELSAVGISRAELNEYEYLKSEPLLRNVFYIVRLIKNQQAAEQSKGSTILRKLVPDSLTTNKDPWQLIAIGSDYDGLIDPIDFAPTVSYVPLLQKRLVVYAYIFSQLHKDEFGLPGTNAPFFSGLQESKLKMRQLFYENGKNFMLKYF